MIISDLNYLEVTSEEIFGGVGVQINTNNNQNTTVRVNVSEVFNKSFRINTSGIQGNTAEVTGSSDASGNNTFTSITFGTQTEPGKSESTVAAVSVSK
ncbi:MAG: hypothetical protein DSM106950_43405 [Stigonema ocellatum SAG 48.90 = DSM 106950]|nr:hypothetical protein [Stigonema ocellatum SAG 48.90 = DSM 106950]